MIPLRLQIKNFLSYGSELQTIDFGTYNLICLSGKNGHGKSALLDAITWAIWGYARKTVGAAKADQGLLRLGQNNMLVYLDFACNDIHYRIRRELSMHHGKPLASLDFGVIQQDGSTISLSDKTIRATQATIERTIHLDFESFCNSTFLRQGQSNEFCKKSPKERKDILTRILGLEQYEIIRQLALEKAKKLLAERQQVLLLQESITTEIEAKEQVHAQHVQLLTTITNADATSAHHEELLQQQKNALASLTQQEQLYAVDRFALEQASVHIHEAYERLRMLRKDWKQSHKQLIKTNNYEQLKKELDTLTIASQQHQAKFQKILQLKEQYLLKKQELQQFESDWQKGFQQQLQQEKNTYTERLIRHKQCEEEIARIIAKQHEITSKQQRTHQDIATATQQINELQALTPYYEAQKKNLDRRKEGYQRHSAEGTIRTQQLKELRHKQALATKTQEASCPLCEQTVSASRRRFLELKYTKEERFLTHRIQRLTALVTRLKQTMIEQYAALEPLEKKILARSAQEAQLSMHTQTLKTITQEAEAVHTQLSSLQQQFIAAQVELKQQSLHIAQHEAAEKTKLQLEQRHISLKKEMSELERTAKEVQYNQTDHMQTEERRRTAQQMIEQHTQIINQRPLQEDRKKQISELCLQIRQLIHKKNELLKKIEPTHDLKKQREQLDITIGVTTAQLKATYATKEQLFQHKGAIDAQLKKIALYEEKQNILSAEIAQKMVHYHDLTAIAHAMSKDGIQALLIEDVIPDIEHEANELLSRLTNNQAHIIIESLKDLKSGKTKETLDIFISDGLGIRSYELFSGGEAFRIDFALRIAISKLVARRAGTALQTLIIDEGFGSQDEEGLTLIMDAIHAIQQDFEKIIIVSHLPFMKDQFPVHFNIEKGPLGSTIAVLHQG